MRQPLAMIYHVQPKLAEEERTEIQSTEHRVIVEIVESFLCFLRLYLPSTCILLIVLLVVDGGTDAITDKPCILQKI